MNTAVLIRSVTARPSLRGTLYRITDTQGQRYSTLDPWQASLCREAIRVQQPVVIWSSEGFYDRRMRACKFAEQNAVSA